MHGCFLVLLEVHKAVACHQVQQSSKAKDDPLWDLVDPCSLDRISEPAGGKGNIYKDSQ